ncbi:MAG: DUF1517 domain-containing protein [Elainella sp. C42_A2020_010]|nr:DUF1517 domain-containing protein [Elainella sp. C42_A2020_010]
MNSTRPFSLAKYLIAAGLSFGVVGGLINLPNGLGPNWLTNQALAQSGGRARGGSFDRPAAPQQAPSGGGSSGGYRGGYSSPYDYSVPYDYSYPSRPDYYPYPAPYSRPRVIVVPPQSYPVPVDPGYGTGYGTSSSGDGLFLILVLLLGASMLPVLMNYLRASRSSSSSSSREIGASELANDIVTVTQVQVALLAQARYIQDELTQISLQANLNTPEGLAEFLRETVLALLRSPENWTHARVNSQTVKSRQQAAQLFEQLSIQERSKLSSETLVNVGGNIRRQSLQVDKDADPASYIVVTLLVGTADDRPLANPVHSTAELAAVLQRLGGITPAYLMIYELIWSPQDASDSLSREQLLTHYSDLVQIA